MGEKIEVHELRAHTIEPGGRHIVLQFATPRGKDLPIRMSSMYLGGLIDILQQAEIATKQAGAKHVSMSIIQPKKWAVKEDVLAGIVVLAFDPDTPHDHRFALSPKPAQALAQALHERAERVLNQGDRAKH